MDVQISEVDVVDKLRSGEYVKFKFVGKKGSESEKVWSNFFKIKDRDNNVIPFAICANDKCSSKPFRFPKGRSTSNLKKHQCLNLKRKSDSEDNASAKKLCSVPEKIKKKALHACANFVTKDLRPYSTINGDGFYTMAKSFIEIGVELNTKKFDITDIVPHRTSVSRRIRDQQGDKLKIVIEKVKPIIEAENCDLGNCAATLDFWTEPHCQNNFLTFMIHYIVDDWTLHCHNLFTLCFEKYNEDGIEVKKSAENIVAALQKKFIEIGLGADAFEKFNYTTDQGSNLVKALKDNDRVNCSAHMLNLVLKNTFTDEGLKTAAPTVLGLLKKAKALVEYLKRSGKMMKLSRRVVQECSTRWNTKYDMLVILNEDYDEIDTLMVEDGEEHRMIGIDKQLLQKIISVLKPFKDATEAISTDKNPSLQTVMFQKNKIADILNTQLIKEKNEEMMKTIKRCLSVLDEKFVVDDAHKIACFFWPEYKQMRYLKEDERKTVESLVRSELEKTRENLIENVTSTTASSEDDADSFDDRFRDVPEAATSSSSTYSDQDSDLFDDKYRDVAESCDPIASELIRYRSSDSSKGTLQWWRSHATEFPLLSKIARKYLAWPASSGSSERCFSIAGRVVEERRTNLSPESLDAVLFLHSLPEN